MGPSDLGGTYFVKAELDDLWRGSGLECTGEMDKVQEELLDCWRSIVTYARSKLRYIQRPGLPQPFTFTQLEFTTIDTSSFKVHAQNGIYASTVQPAGSRGRDHVLREKFEPLTKLYCYKFATTTTRYVLMTLLLKLYLESSLNRTSDLSALWTREQGTGQSITGRP